MKINVDDVHFNKLMEHYKPTFISWHRHITKYMRIEREAFLCEFQYILFKSMLKFDVEKSTAASARFERYFFASLRKMSNSLLRKSNSKKRKKEKQFIPFSLKKHDLQDTRHPSPLEVMAANDMLTHCFKDESRKIIVLRLMGNTVGEVCTTLKMPHHVYRRVIRNIKQNEDLTHNLSCE